MSFTTHAAPSRSPVPFAPLARVVAAHGGVRILLETVAVRPDEDPGRVAARIARAWYRGAATGRLTVRAADLLTVRLLRVTPWQIWPAWALLDTAPVTEPRRERSARAA